MSAKITFAVTGASAMPIAMRLLKELILAKCCVNFVISKAGILTIQEELNLKLSQNPKTTKERLEEFFNLDCANLSVYGIHDWYSPIASGSNVDDAMVVCPWSMFTVAKIANGMSDDLISRAADVIIKESKQLIIVPREMPFSAIHLKNMLELAKLGVKIIPPVVAFYNHPKTVDDIISFLVSRILDQLHIYNELTERWNGHI